MKDPVNFKRSEGQSVQEGTYRLNCLPNIRVPILFCTVHVGSYIHTYLSDWVDHTDITSFVVELR